MANLRAKKIKNFGHVANALVVSYVVQRGVTIILARTLFSSGYGIVGYAFVFIDFLARFKDVGVNDVVIHRIQLNERALYTGFTMKMFLSVIVYGWHRQVAPGPKCLENILRSWCN